MTLFTGFVAYILIWWTVLFAVLPWGLVRDEQGRPENPRLRLKFLVTSGISAIILLALYLMIRADIIDFRALSMQMMAEDAAR